MKKSRFTEEKIIGLRRLKELEAENARLKRMYADLSLTHQALQEVVANKIALSPRRRADLAAQIGKDYGVSVRNACRAVRLPRSWYYAPPP